MDGSTPAARPRARAPVLSDLSIRNAAREVPNQVALIDRRGELTFSALATLAHQQVERIGPGRVLIAPRPNREDIATLLGMLDRRISFALASRRWTDREVDDAIVRTGASTVIRDGERAPTVHRGHPAEQLLVFTSGSSGRAKIVRLSHEALRAAAAAHARALPWTEDDAWVLTLPLGHIGGLSVLTRSLYARRPVVLGPERFDARSTLDAMESARGTLLSLVPTTLRRLLDRGSEPPGSLRAVLLGGAAAEPALIARARSAGWPVLPTYGMSETCAQVCTQRLGDLCPAGVGPPLPGISVRIEQGQIEVSGPTLMIGYLDADPLPAQWYRTGDLGRIDERGHLHVLGRVGARIITGGENVDPVEVELALVAHPEVVEAVVVGAPDAQWGEAVVACVVTRGTVADEELRRHLSARLADYKLPKRVERVRALPRLDSGKVDRAAVERSMLQGVSDEPPSVGS